uniref:Uncharacterized protein n=1 Tax=viral metagenome TaxID=1070528 RepID=A0A6M3Y4Q0_9ZZZZ
MPAPVRPDRGIATRNRNQHWGVFEFDPASPLLDMGAGEGWDRAVEIEWERFRRQLAARLPQPTPNPKPPGI